MTSFVFCPCIQLSQNFTCNRPRQPPCPLTYTAHTSSVSTVLQCPDNCVTVNVNVCVIITCITELCNLLCALPNTLNITSVCFSLPCLYVAADVHPIYKQRVTFRDALSLCCCHLYKSMSCAKIIVLFDI